MKEKAKRKEFGKEKVYCFLFFMLLTVLVSACKSDGEKVSLDKLLAGETVRDGYNNALQNDTSQKDTLQKEEQKDKEQTGNSVLPTVWVHVCGEVEVPGIYELPVGSRVYDGLVLAGGFTEAADTTYYNLAETLCDGMKIEIPAWEQSGKPGGDQGDTEEKEKLININTATLEELQTLPGIGASRAADIITYREKQGKFKDTAEIMKVSGIKESVYEKIKDKITAK